MPSHQERVRRNYLCPACDGEGKTSDCGEGGMFTCDECDGSGIVLTPPKPRGPQRPMTGTERFIATEALKTLGIDLEIARRISRPLD